MKKMILITAALATFAFQAQAADYQCVPTKTVEVATADYNNGLLVLGVALTAEYDAATVQLHQDYDAALVLYKEQVKTLNHDFQKEVSAIKRDLNPGWRQVVAEATTRHNEDLLALRDELQVQNNMAVDLYNYSTEQSRLNYNYQAAQLANEYNRAVCAVY